jgi:DNA-binding MarR family transcriptional regulator
MPKDDRLIYLLFRAQHKLRAHLKKALHEKGIRITPAQAGVLFLLKQRNGRTMSELSQVLSTDNSTITGLVDRLERSGFVKRNPSATDRRVSHISMTVHGLEEIERAKPIIREVNAEIRTGFSDEDIETFKKVINRISDRFETG